eukprot:sb/3469031/
MRTWEKNTCIQFRRRTPNDANYVRFTSDKGCYATIGQGEGEQTLSLGKGCGTPGFALHELAHVIGFFHEQSRPDRDDYVDVLWENIRDDKKEQFAKYSEDEIDPRGIPYDYLSITHYGPYDFRLKPGYKKLDGEVIRKIAIWISMLTINTCIISLGLSTLKVKKLPENPADMGQRRYLSDYDIIGANTLYQCTKHLGKQPIMTRYIDHVTCFQPIRDQYFLIRSVTTCNFRETVQVRYPVH